MIPNGNCPKCNAVLDSVSLKQIKVKATGQNWFGVSYQCPYCNAVLSVSIDPVALKEDIVTQILESLRKR